MDLEQQLQVLIDDSPQDGHTPKLIEQVVKPVLIAFAQQLQHKTYFTYQSLQGSWLLTTLSNRQSPTVEKKVIYAFSTLADAKTFQGLNPDPQLLAIEIPVTHILFQLFALQDLDSIIFMDTPNNLKAGTEIQRNDLQRAIQAQLIQYRQSQSPSTRLA